MRLQLQFQRLSHRSCPVRQTWLTVRIFLSGNDQRSIRKLGILNRLLRSVARQRRELPAWHALSWFFFFFFRLPRNLIVVIFALQLFLIFFRHLSMNRLSLWRSGAALMFLMHYRIGDPICFLLVLVTGLAHRKLHLRPWSRRGSASATPLKSFVIGFGLDFIRVLLHHVSQFVSQ